MAEIDDVSDAIETLSDAIEAKIEDVDVSPAEIAVSSEYQAPWDRLPEENDQQWDLFTHFRDSGLQRSAKKTTIYAAEKYGWKSHRNGEEPTPSEKNQVFGFIGKHRWRERVFAYDAEQERLYQVARSEAIRDMAQRHEDTIEKAINGLMAPIEALNMALDNDPEFLASLSKKDASKLIDLSNRAGRTIPSLMAAERLARGMPTEIVGGVVEHQVVHSVDRNQISEVLSVLGRAGKLPVAGADLGLGEIVDAEVVEVHSLPAESHD